MTFILLRDIPNKSKHTAVLRVDDARINNDVWMILCNKGGIRTLPTYSRYINKLAKVHFPVTKCSIICNLSEEEEENRIPTTAVPEWKLESVFVRIQSHCVQPIIII